ncbi:MAG TPA: tRNA (adenosine(37)-N6)-dimethylallyltransferase MiaA [Polyangiaceae bacterium LLY-WYZ-15_(1-7)]|nr:tRNA (adenosine(37)-N6)-dimethylallyltransferase MiaA [Myxococcales bacterium]MAT29281.1 tRNA (adenosine(37)-N6)-dimethylallyltransferase MiaA [Sandaracinus sp.]HJL05468.1 tRNA (adenosine(37)-N6)-dimethylallyltransferase MiaA [Polyangiaceae bacterium LLY-WYZ-15_(1-7)]MBJ73269.1 tRNA (adenosine(37)-N6)-dimethylallyltransferase MiaA [Sandaracinus sp.]HJL12795.1 tRNA (adenosine(37)-N6)-dimethylallyltransferase MiaA [Polyangiaceae bacterium LLY-WYZ-15_(1-7)]
MSRPPLLVLAGPTASGKTAAGLHLARRLGGELVGADSVQVYRGFDIGSAKPSVEELGGIPHHLLDVLDPDESIDAMGFARLADRAIEAIAARDRVPIVVGGTGLWIRALVRGLVDVPPPDPAIRGRLEAEAKAAGAPALHARLAEVDPLSAEAVHPNDALRIVRALEVFEQTGRPLGELRAEHALGAPRYPTLLVVLERDKDELEGRIEARLDAMLEADWIDEVRGLLGRWPRTARAFGSVGYKEIVAHLEDAVPLDETRRRIRKSTRVYARRQRTWFRSEPGVGWRTRAEGLMDDEGLARVRAFLEGEGGPGESGPPLAAS